MNPEFRFPYKTKPSERGRLGSYILYPLIPVQLYSNKSRPISFEALLDSGADEVLIPKGSAEMISLEMGEKKQMDSASERSNCYEVNVGLVLGQVKGCRIDLGYINAKVPEKDSGNVPILIGRNPFFQNFEIIFQQYNVKPSCVLKLKNPNLKLS